ncbi:hypothetical protein B0H21DRAFT_762171 [Amylocystis lapponica]|nr:hypothetical protein B0H21DRAFT_762171 [Amylocystis lapponica]
MSTDTAHTSPELLALRDRIQALTDLNTRVQALRQIPANILRAPTSTNILAVSPTTQIRHDFQELREVADALRSERVQHALVAARDSEQRDKSNLSSTGRRVNRKRRRPPSPDSPQPYRPFQQKSASLFPDIADGPPPLGLDGLPVFLREHNTTHAHSKLGIWSPARSRTLACPVVLRFAIRDVVVVFLTLGQSAEGAPLIVENATAFGPREKVKTITFTIDYTVYQKISQQIAKMLQSQPDVSLQIVIDLLNSYEHLFVHRCTVCQRVLSMEAHVPPIARSWSDTAPEGGAPGWQPRHPTCR